MSVSGLLSTMNLPELLQWAKFGQKTGSVVLERKGFVKKIFVEGGLIVSASSNDPKEYLGQVLLCFGWVTEEQLKEAFQNQSDNKQLLGRVLVEKYGVKADQIKKALRIKIEETVYDLFLWEDGKFIYSDGIPQIAKHDRLDNPITIDHVILEGARRVDEWKEFKKTFPTDDVVFALKGERRTIGDLAKDFIIQKIYEGIDGGKSIRRILLESRAPEYRGLEGFAKLYWGGFIEAIKKTVERVEVAKSSSADLLKRAIELFKTKEFEKSYSLIDELILNDPANEEGQTLFKVVREAYLKKLYEICPAEAIPEIAIDFSDLNEKLFSSLEGFLASRINGHWDIKSLIMISPLPDLESLKIMKRFLDEGVIKLKRQDQRNETK
ncbi:MAG: hypothetical protein JWQ35_1171 [Bacteriovoracaceae bacterium]|nr:hypothetical protein [Bacteriovoracaceae bacterium]